MADTLYVCAQGLLPERLILVGHHRRRRFDSPGAKHSPPEKMENLFDSSISENIYFEPFTIRANTIFAFRSISATSGDKKLNSYNWIGRIRLPRIFPFRKEILYI